MLPQRRQLGQAVAGYLMVTIAIVTLVPFSFRWPSSWRLTGFVTLSDLVQNIALFVPLGFAIAFAGGRALLIGAALSFAVELAQQGIPGRFSSPVDFATNALGAAIGAAGFGIVSARLGRRGQGAGIKALDLPLMGTVYLVIPLVWLIGLSAPIDPSRPWLVWLPLLAGVIVLAAVSRHHLEPQGISRWTGAAAAGVWAALALLPGWHGDPWLVMIGAAAAAAATGFLAWLAVAREPVGRRFEGITVRRAVLPLAVFLALAAGWPLTGIGGAWSWSLGWSGAPEATTRDGILQVLELMAAATVIGYGVAEGRSRAVEPGERTRWVLVLVAGAGALGVELIRSLQPARGASLLEGVLLTAATIFGGTLYWRQRRYVLALLGRLPAGPSGSDPAAGYGRIVPVPAAGAPKWR